MEPALRPEDIIGVGENADEEMILGHMENQPLMSIGGCVMNNVFIEIVDTLYKGKYYLLTSSICNIDFFVIILYCS